MSKHKPGTLTKGSKWRRTSDGLIVTVLEVMPKSYFGGYVQHLGKRRTTTSLDGFLKKYELVEEAPDE